MEGYIVEFVTVAGSLGVDESAAVALGERVHGQCDALHEATARRAL